jgi:hypothetical protein
MAKIAIRHNPRTAQTWEDIEQYLEFCKDFGYVYNPEDIYRRETPWGQFMRLRQGKGVRNNWNEDARRLRGL